MKLRTLIKFGVIHLSVLTIVLFLRFSTKNNEPMNVAILRSLVYLPYLLGLTVLNLGLLSLGLLYFKNKLKPFAVVFTSLVLMVWYFISGGHLQMFGWKITQAGFWYFNLIILFLNFRVIMSLRKKQEKEPVSE
ncbi:MAG: hypothetical protein V4658_13080 [Bacteroidota bacterium]